MCFKKLFGKPDPEPIQHPMRKALLFGINDYPGSGSDLRGCVNDVYDFKAKLEDEFSEFDIEIYTDEQVTVANFKRIVQKWIDLLEPGDILVVHYSGHGTYVIDKDGDEGDGYDEALYLHDGPLVDDDIGNMLEGIPEGATVVMMLDCCYSGTITRKVTKDGIRFLPIDGQPEPGKKVKSRVAVRDTMKWITFSGSSSEQTSADAYINGRYNGAFTYFFLKYLSDNITYTQWHQYVKDALANSRFSQVPQLEGPFAMINSLVFFI